MEENNDIKVLLVDDDPDILFATERIIKKMGFSTLSTGTGYGCLELVESQQPDLILLDVDLPDIGGVEVCQKLKSEPTHSKRYIMMLSGHKVTSEDQADGLDSGADGYVARPVSNRELASRVASMARLIRAERKCDAYIVELEEALEKIKVLSGIVPICMHCKKIRDDQGYWNQLESFIQKHSSAQFSHGVCDSCLKTYYPDEKEEE